MKTWKHHHLGSEERRMKKNIITKASLLFSSECMCCAIFIKCQDVRKNTVVLEQKKMIIFYNMKKGKYMQRV